MTKWIIILSLIFLASPVRADEPVHLEKYLYYQIREGLADENMKTLESIWTRASKLGYTKVILADPKLNRLSSQPSRYFRNVKRVKSLAAKLNLEIVPAVFPIGYSASLLSYDPDLAEALPVKDAPYVVKNGAAHLIQNDYPEIKSEGPVRVEQKLQVSPFRQYHLFFKAKTKNYKGSPEVRIMAGDDLKRSLNGVKPIIKSNQGWIEYHFIFNSLNSSEILLVLHPGYKKTGGGELWWKDIHLEEVGFMNLVRRDGASLQVKTEEGLLLKEGKDFKPLHDPNIKKYSWPWHSVYHKPPVLKVNLSDGTRLKVSYYHATVNRTGQVMICPSESKSVDIMRQVFQEIHQLWNAKSYFMKHNEIRTLGWDLSCESRKLTAGEILADNLKTCTGIIKESCPECTIYVWEDMFDPFRNALKKNYYLVKDDLSGSWEGLDKDVVVANWNSRRPKDSLKFFADRGNRQIIAGYYDEFPGSLDLWLSQLKDNRYNVIGIMYTTWRDKYEDLESFTKAIDDWRNNL